MAVCLSRVELDVSQQWFQKGILQRDDYGFSLAMFVSPFHPYRTVRAKTLDELAMKVWQERTAGKFGRILLP